MSEAHIEFRKIPWAKTICTFNKQGSVDWIQPAQDRVQ